MDEARDFLAEIAENDGDFLYHHGILGQKWGRRRFQYNDGSLTPEGERRYLINDGRVKYDTDGETERDRKEKTGHKQDTPKPSRAKMESRKGDNSSEAKAANNKNETSEHKTDSSGETKAANSKNETSEHKTDSDRPRKKITHKPTKEDIDTAKKAVAVGLGVAAAGLTTYAAYKAITQKKNMSAVYDVSSALASAAKDDPRKSVALKKETLKDKASSLKWIMTTDNALSNEQRRALNDRIQKRAKISTGLKEVEVADWYGWGGEKQYETQASYKKNLLAPIQNAADRIKTRGEVAKKYLSGEYVQGTRERAESTGTETANVNVLMDSLVFDNFGVTSDRVDWMQAMRETEMKDLDFGTRAAAKLMSYKR